MTDTYNKVAGALDESRALLAEVMAELTAAAERERVLREALEGAISEYEQMARDNYEGTMHIGGMLRLVGRWHAALEATK